MRSVQTALTIGAGALLLAVAPWEDYGFYGYYIFLRFLVCGICIFAAYASLRARSSLAFPFLLAGILFNPIVKAHLTREIWIGVDVLVATLFLAIARYAPRLGAAPGLIFPPRVAEADVQTAEASS